MCNHFVDGKNVVKNGKTSTGIQRWFCKGCGKSFQEKYSYSSYLVDYSQIILLTKESCSIRSTARILNISTSTVIRRIKKIASNLVRPYPIMRSKHYEVDELFTYVGNKQNRVCIAYSLEKDTGRIIDFIVGRRNKSNLRRITDTLILSDAKQIVTDKLNIYKELIPKEIHSTKFRGINKIERKNLTLRTHLKRLNRKTICYSKSLSMLTAIMKIYFWE